MNPRHQQALEKFSLVMETICSLAASIETVERQIQDLQNQKNLLRQQLGAQFDEKSSIENVLYSSE